jgi:uncharacterized membrane protein
MTIVDRFGYYLYRLMLYLIQQTVAEEIFVSLDDNSNTYDQFLEALIMIYLLMIP